MPPSKTALAVVAMAAAAHAQIIAVELVPDARKAFAKWSVEKEGRLLVCGDPIEGFKWDPATNTITRLGVKKVVIAVPDPARPEAAVGEDRHVAIETAKLLKHEVLLPHETCTGLREDYLRKRARADEARKKLSGPKSGSPEWFAAHRGLITELDTLALWLRSTLFPAAAEKLEKEQVNELKRQGAAASKARLEAAKKLSKPEPPESLAQKSREYGHGELGWYRRETQHLQVIAHSGVSATTVEEALGFGERIIDGYRSVYVDPFLAAGETDPIPEGKILEFILVPDEEEFAVKLYEGWLGRSIGEPRDRRKSIKGHRGRSGSAVQEYWRHGDSGDFEGLLAHGLGHTLAGLHFARGGEAPAWIDEGFAYWISFEYLSRNTVTCFAFALPAGYTRTAEKEGEKVVERGLRVKFNEVALEKGPPLTELFRMKLVEMTGADFAKSWSFVDFLLTEHKPRLAPLLRGACEATGGDGRTNLERFRKSCDQVFPGPPGNNVFLEIEKLWKAFAQGTQKAGGKR